MSSFKEKSLVVILRVSGLILMSAFIAVFLPYKTMADIHRWIGLGDFPLLSILDYLARSVSLFYAVHGIILFYVSFDIFKYLQFIKLLCYLGFLFGICLIFIDIQASMPAYWIICEGPSALLLSGLIFMLTKKIEKGKVMINEKKQNL